MYRGELKDEYLEAALLGAHGSATSIMLAIGSEELAAAATDGDGDGRVLANFWYLPGDFKAALEVADAVAMKGEVVIEELVRLSVAFRPDNGEVLFRLAAERSVLEAVGDEWHTLSLARRQAWQVFGLVSNRVYDVLLEADNQIEKVARIRVPSLEETIFDQDREGTEDPVRKAAAEMMAKPAKPRKGKKKASEDSDPPALSVTSPARIQLPPEDGTQSETAEN